MCYNVSSPKTTTYEERSNVVIDGREVLDAVNSLKDIVDRYESEVSDVSQELNTKIDTLNDLNGGLENDLDTLSGYLDSLSGIEEAINSLDSNIEEVNAEIGG